MSNETRELERPVVVPTATTPADGRVEQLRARIEAGEYAVDVDELAEAFVVDEALRARGLR